MDNAASKLKTGILFAVLAAFFLFSLGIALFSYRVDRDDQYRSTSLRMAVEESGNVTTTSYLDGDGKPAAAAELGYAVKKSTKNGNTVSEEYFDEKGERVRLSAGYYGLLREYNDLQQPVKLTYLDEEGHPVMIDTGYASMVRTFNSEGLTAAEHFMNIEGEAVATESYGYGRIFSYNENGFDVVIRYVDQYDRPVMTKQNLAISKRVLYSEEPDTGRIEYEYFYDENDRPYAQRDVIYGIHRKYDECGRASDITYLGSDGKPVTGPDGYATIKRTYYEDDSIRTDMYYDSKGAPVRLQQGQYGILRENDKVTYLDADGKEIFNLKNYLYNQPLSVIVAAIAALCISLFGGKRLNLILLVIYVCAILYMTVYRRSQSSEIINMEPFWSYRQFFSDPLLRKDIMDNIWLFVPLGTILFRIFGKCRVMLIPAALAVLIEIAQYITGRGLAELDDVISNGLGGIIGVGIGYLVMLILQGRKEKRELQG